MRNFILSVACFGSFLFGVLGFLHWLNTGEKVSYEFVWAKDLAIGFLILRILPETP